jgi:site-specific DNA-methyltransferase (adenine-specific)
MEFAYDVEGFRLLQGDALKIMRELPPESFDMIFADPPYFLSNGGFTVHAGKRASVHKGKWDKSRGVDEDMSFHQAWVEEAYRLLKPAGTIWISGTYHSIYQCGYALQSTGFHILNDIAWFKPNASPNLSCRMFTASHETLIWARKDKRARHYFDYKAMKNGEWPGDMMKKPDLQMRSVWAIGTPKPSEKIHGKHPTQKPVELLRRVILASTPPGASILDPFAGSSTTGIAATLIGDRQFTGIERDKKFIELSIKRHRDIVSARESTWSVAIPIAA